MATPHSVQSDAPDGLRGASTAVNFALSDELRELVQEVRSFVREDVRPADADVGGDDRIEARWEVVDELRGIARDRGIFAPHLPPAWGGLGVGVLGMALISQECESMLASLALNAMAPDEGNMHTLLHAATPTQLEQFLRPLAEGRARSCFAMTEPGVASSDPTNLTTAAVRDGDHWVLNGRKWFTTGARGATFAIVVARTGGDELPARSRYSLFLVPTDTPGWNVVRDPGILGAHYVGGHPEVALEDVRVPAENLLGDEGAGFTISQVRLAGGRLAHAMRWIGAAQLALDLMTRRLHEREAFGRPLAEHQALQWFIADSATDLYASRVMVLHAAWKVENGLPHREEVSMVKTFVSEAFGRVVDRAVQIFGADGIADDLPIERLYRDARAARIYDGASEVHRMVIARSLLRLARDGGSTRSACGDLLERAGR